MIQIIFISMLFAIPGALLFAVNEEIEVLEIIERRANISAAGMRDRTGIHSRLEELGKRTERDYQDFRIRQFGYCASTAALVMVLMTTSGKDFLATALFTTLAAGVIFILIDRELTSQIKKHREAIEAEFPAIIEMMTLAIAAGETPMQAILRITDSAEGELSKEFAVVIAEIRTGQPLHVTLDSLGRRVKSVMIRRFVDAVVTATLRGAPLIEVLSRHAVEARANQRNRIMNAAGKAEV
ncbi:MAG: type II secretion system F family protein, partial [Actinomycetes bacterium]